MLSKRNIFKSGAAFFSVNVCGAVISLILQIYLARTMDASEFGQYILILNWIAFLVVISKCGFDSLTTRLVAEYTATNSSHKSPKLISLGRFTVFVIGTISGTLFVLFWGLCRQENELLLPFVVGAMLIIPLALLQLNKAILLALRRPVLGLLPEQLLRHLLTAIIITIGAVWIGIKVSASFVICSTLASAIMMLTLSIYCVSNVIDDKVVTGLHYDIKPWFSAAATLSIVEIAALSIGKIDILILGAIVPADHVAIYGIASTLASCAAFFESAAFSVVGPHFSVYNVTKNIGAIQKLFTNSARILSAVVLVFIAVVFTLNQTILSFFGERFRDGNIILAWLLAAQFVNVFTGLVGYLLPMTGYHRQFALAMVLTAVLNAMLNLFFVLFWGIEGAAAATFIATIIRSAALSFLVWSYMGVIPTVMGPGITKVFSPRCRKS